MWGELGVDICCVHSCHLPDRPRHEVTKRSRRRKRWSEHNPQKKKQFFRVLYAYLMKLLDFAMYACMASRYHVSTITPINHCHPLFEQSARLIIIIVNPSYVFSPKDQFIFIRFFLYFLSFSSSSCLQRAINAMKKSVWRIKDVNKNGRSGYNPLESIENVIKLVGYFLFVISAVCPSNLSHVLRGNHLSVSRALDFYRLSQLVASEIIE